jgi:hypothetical protein
MTLPDPNWLLSTVVQSTAAFIAIVAGFILSRLLALSAEKSGLETRVRDIELQLKIKIQTIISIKEHLLKWDATNFLEDSDALILRNKGDISLVDAMSIAANCERDEDELRPYWDDVISTTKDAFRVVNDFFSNAEGAKDFDVFLKGLGLNLSHDHWKRYHRVFNYFIDQYESNRNSSFPNFSILTTIPEFRTKDETGKELKRDIQKLEQDKNALETQVSDLKSQLKNLGQPKGVTLGMVVLVYFAVVGIVIPVFLLPFPPEQFTPILQCGVFLLFFSGLLSFFAYLAKLIWQLK